VATVYADTDERVAHLPGVIAEVSQVAKDAGKEAEVLLAEHRVKRHARIEVTHGSVDSFVSLSDERGQRAAAAIEYGRSGGKRGPSQGIFVLHRAFGI
jgi:hypothetical protein